MRKRPSVPMPHERKKLLEELREIPRLYLQGREERRDAMRRQLMIIHEIASVPFDPNDFVETAYSDAESFAAMADLVSEGGSSWLQRTPHIHPNGVDVPALHPTGSN